MKFTVLTLNLALITSLTSAATTLNVAAVISSFFPSSTPQLNAAQSTSLASIIYSVESAWHNSPAYTTAAEAIYSAAPSSVQASFLESGYYYEDIITQTWYSQNVPKAVQTAVNAEISSIDNAVEKILGTPTTSSKGAGARPTAMGVVGVVGVLGGVLAAL